MEIHRRTLALIPALACGSGPPLVWLGGLSPEAGVDRPAMRRVNLASVAPYARRREVFFTNRRPGLPRGMTMAALAAEHAEAVQRGFHGEPVDVVGVSTGGSVAQQMAADHPEVVRSLVLMSTACRLGALGRELQRRAAARIRAGAHRQALAVMAAGLVPARRGRLAAGMLAWALGPRTFPHRGDMDDMATTIEAEDAFDLARCAAPIRARSLLVFGSADRFYGPELFAETARMIPGCRVHELTGRGHITALGLPSVPATVLGFLDGAAASS